MELNRDQIIKALECCEYRACQKCVMLTRGRPVEDDCRLDAIHDALALIKELVKENERIKADTIRNIKIRVYNKAVYPDGTREHAYFSLKAFDNIIDSYRKE